MLNVQIDIPFQLEAKAIRLVVLAYHNRISLQAALVGCYNIKRTTTVSSTQQIRTTTYKPVTDDKSSTTRYEVTTQVETVEPTSSSIMTTTKMNDYQTIERNL